MLSDVIASANKSAALRFVHQSTTLPRHTKSLCLDVPQGRSRRSRSAQHECSVGSWVQDVGGVNSIISCQDDTLVDADVENSSGQAHLPIQTHKRDTHPIEASHTPQSAEISDMSLHNFRAAMTSTQCRKTPSIKSLPVPSQARIINEHMKMELSITSTEDSAKESPRFLPSGSQNQERNQTSTFSNTLWQQIQKQRIANWTLLSQIHEIRATLRRKQREKSVADDALFRKMVGDQSLWQLQMNRELSQDHKHLLSLRDNCQRIRDEYGPLEDDCNQLEDQLSSQEFRLGKMEEDLYNLQSKESFAAATDLDLNYRPEEHEERNGGNLDELELYSLHPHVNAFLSRLGDLDLLQERLEDLSMEYERLKGEEVRLARVGTSLSRGNQSFLDGFGVTHKELLERIQMTGRDVHIMRQECLKRRLIDENDEPTDLKAQEEVQFVEERELEPVHSTSDYVKYPLLLPRPGNKAGLRKSESEYDKTTDSTTKRINEWLLEKLHVSPLDVMLLASIFEKKGGKIDERWEVCVLAVWFNDGTKTWNTETASYSSLSLSESYASDVVAQEAYSGAIEYFQHELTGDSKGREWIKNPKASISGVIKAVDSAKTEYSTKDDHRSTKAKKWVDVFASRVPNYGRALDTLAQRHPEYTALTWGILRFLLLGVFMQTEMIVKLLKALFKIGEALPFIGSGIDAYRKPYIRQAASRVYAHIMLFLQLAVKWYSLGTAHSALRVIKGPFALTHLKTVEQIHACKEYIDKLTDVEYPVETHGLVAFMEQQDQTLRQMRYRLNTLTKESHKRYNKALYFLQVAMLTKPKLERTNLEVEGQRNFIRNMYCKDVLDILRPCRSPDGVLRDSHSLARRRKLWSLPDQDRCPFLQTLLHWTSMPGSSLFFVRADSSAKTRIKDLAIEVAVLIKKSGYEIFWHISECINGGYNYDLVDLIKGLIFQLFKRNPMLLTTDNGSLAAAKFQSEHFEREWIDLLLLLLRRVPRCFVLIDTEWMLSNPSSWTKTLFRIFDQAIANSKRDGNLIKVLLITYGAHRARTNVMGYEHITSYIKPVSRGLLRAERNSTRKPRLLCNHEFDMLLFISTSEESRILLI